MTALQSVLAEIARGERQVRLPSALSWPGGRELVPKKLLRLLPGKRAVLAAELEGRSVLVKLFVPAGLRQLERELEGHRKLIESHIRTPALLEQCSLDGGGALIYEFLREAVPIAEEGGLPAEPHLRLLLDQIMAGYRAGIYQRDLHWGNFLVVDGRLYAIDTGDVAGVLGSPLPQQVIVANLGLLVAQCRREDQRKVLDIIKCHPVMRMLDARAPSDLVEAAESSWQERKRRALEKCFRDTTAVYFRHEFSRVCAARRGRLGPDLQEFFDNPDPWLGCGMRLKNGNSATVVKAQMDGRWVVIKRYNIKNPLHRLRRCLRPTRAWVSWRNAHLLDLIGIATPAPVAFLERRQGPLRGVAYYICDWVDATELAELLAKADPDAAQVEQIAALFHRLRLGQLYHGDLKARNLLMGEGKLYLIDLDALCEVRPSNRFRELHRRDLERFLRNWDDRPQLRARLAKEIMRHA